MSPAGEAGSRSSSSAHHVESLTWVRGVAALLVIVTHVVEATKVSYTPHDAGVRLLAFDLFALGRFGVAVFFALSGCALYLSNSRLHGWTGTLGFYAKRFMRIWPAFAASVLAYIAFSWVFEVLYAERQGHWLERALLTEWDGWALAKYLALVFNVTGPSHLFNGAYWSLPVEFQYYLIFPVLLASMRWSGLLGPVVVCLGLYLVASLRLVEVARYEFFLLAYTFGGGMACGYLYERSGFRLRPATGIAILASIVVIVSMITNGYYDPSALPVLWRRWHWYGLLAVMTVLVTVFSDFGPGHGRIARFFSHYGTISYSTYLFHDLFVGAAILVVIHSGLDGAAKVLFTFAVAFFGSLWLATLGYRFVERPGIVLGRAIARAAVARGRPAPATD